MKTVKIQALKTKNQSMIPGKVYEVSEELRDVLVNGKKAIDASDEMQAGIIYDFPKNETVKRTKKGNGSTTDNSK